MGMALQRKGLVLLTLLSCLVGSCYCYQFTIGGKDGWTPNPSENYNQWSQRMRFLIGDTVLFKYKQGSDSVLEVNKNDYDKCLTQSPIKKMEDGNSIFTFDRSGPFYFISGNKDNCEKGQKVQIVVISVRGKPPSTTPPAPTTPAPSATAPAAAPPSGSSTPGTPGTPGTPSSPNGSPMSPSTGKSPTSSPPTPGGTTPASPPSSGGTTPASPPSSGGTTPASPPSSGGTTPASPPSSGGTTPASPPTPTGVTPTSSPTPTGSQLSPPSPSPAGALSPTISPSSGSPGTSPAPGTSLSPSDSLSPSTAITPAEGPSGSLAPGSSMTPGSMAPGPGGNTPADINSPGGAPAGPNSFAVKASFTPSTVLVSLVLTIALGEFITFSL